MKAKNFIRVARTRDAVFVGVVGLGNMNNSSTFRAFADRMLAAGFRQFVVDLTDCGGMDSTFLGILFSITQPIGGGDPAEVIVVNPCSNHLKLLQAVGLDAILKVKSGETTIPSLSFEILEDVSDPVIRLQTIREAHENLLRLDRKNEEQFGPFLRALAEELR